MSSIPGNVFDDSVPISPGHLPGISISLRDKVHYKHNNVNTNVEQGWVLVQNRCKRGNSNGWKGNNEKKNIIMI
jgi:hypothetical protein